MSLDFIRRWFRPRRRQPDRPSAAVVLAEALPDFAKAGEFERECERRRFTQGIAKARKAKVAAVHAALLSDKPRVRVKAPGRPGHG